MKWAIMWQPQASGPWVPWVDTLFPSRTAAWDFVDRDRNGADAGRPEQRRRTIQRAKRDGLRLCPARIAPECANVYLGTNVDGAAR